MKKYITPNLKVMSLKIQNMIASSISGVDTPTDIESNDRSDLLDGLFD